MKEMGSKNDLQGIIRGLVEDVRDSIVEIEKERGSRKKNLQLSAEAREQLLTNLLSNEKVLTLIYDKTFYSGSNRQMQDIEIPSQLRQILEDKEDEGFD